jgi:hypothetical protein
MRALLRVIAVLLLVQTAAAQADTIFERARNPANRLAFANDGGLADDGVCWWHSRLQRAFLYLARYNPRAPKPTYEKAKSLINDLIWEKAYIEIPGFADTKSFTAAYQNLIQSELNEWQLSDGLINQAWIRGLSGSSSLSSSSMKAHMDDLYTQYLSAHAKNDLLWVMLQESGIASHASLLESMTPNGIGGYIIQMVDSNFPSGMVNYDYRNGDRSLVPNGIDGYTTPWVPYVGYARDLTRIHNAITANRIIR